MEAKAKSKNSGGKDDGYLPVDGSWVAELEDAKAALKDLLRRQKQLRSSSATDAHNEKKNIRGEALQLYLRLCRSYGKLRQWKELSNAAQKGLDVCSTYALAAAAASPSSTSRISEWKARFGAYKKTSQKEQAVKSLVDDPKCAQLFDKVLTGEANLNYVSYPHAAFPDSNILQFAALAGDMRFLEALVARGAALDVPFLRERGESRPPDIAAPSDATALLMVCVNIASAERNRPLHTYPKVAREELDRSTECAMQLVRLGADLTRNLTLSNAPRTMVSEVLRRSGFDGKTLLELAKMTSRTALVELVEQHLSYTPEERAEVVHCRCGSRLPWMACHVTGIGQPPHYFVSPKWGLCYRVAPLARCPCKNTALAHYECCWKDTSTPHYLIDADGEKLKVRAISKLSSQGVLMQETQKRAKEGILPSLPPELVENIHKWAASEIRASRDAFEFVVSSDSPKSQLRTWDPLVYAGCLDRLDEGFFWTDTLWKLDTSELLRQTKEWNKALKKYCDDEGLVGEEREQVIAKHTATPCAPCGRMGCTAFEKKVREFRRCSRCKTIAYCGRECQKKDWPEHRLFCVLIES